ncbi:MAG: hypothetical protein SVR08_15085 [Spirochaetota bacterium]|nr:hypothetical protein [Spirochaetota bacterium]
MKLRSLIAAKAIATALPTSRIRTTIAQKSPACLYTFVVPALPLKFVRGSSLLRMIKSIIAKFNDPIIYAKENKITKVTIIFLLFYIE